jgi:hypothetical protein
MKPKSSRSLYIISIALAILLLSVLAEVFLYRNKAYKNIKDTKFQIKYAEVTPVPTEIIKHQQKPKVWVLKKKIDGEKQTILYLCSEYRKICIEQWKDWIFYLGFEDDSIQIKGYNLKTSESKIIYDVKQNANDYEGMMGKGLPREVSDMQVIDNTLFFSFGGYLAPGATFWVDLPPYVKPQKLAESRNPRIMYWKNRYWLIGGEGDACFRVVDFSLVDLASKKVTHVATSREGCVEGEEYIAIDKRDRMILAYHTPDNRFYEDDEIGVYQYVIAVPLSNPSVKEGVIAKQDMPAEINFIDYFEDSDQLFLIGKKEEYLYDFSSKIIKKSETPLPPIPLDSFRVEYETSKDNRKKPIEDKIKELTLPPEYEIVLE